MHLKSKHACEEHKEPTCGEQEEPTCEEVLLSGMALTEALMTLHIRAMRALFTLGSLWPSKFHVVDKGLKKTLRPCDINHY